MVKKVLVMAMCVLFLASNTVAFAEDVYVTANGTKYHKADCRFIKDRETQKLDKQAAVEQGYVPCQKCSKEDLAEQPSKSDSEKVSKSKKPKAKNEG